MGVKISQMTPLGTALPGDALLEISYNGGTYNVTGQNIFDGAGSGSVKGILFDGTGSTSILGQSGISSLTKVSPGIYKINFSVPMGSATYRVATSARNVIDGDIGIAGIGPGDTSTQLLLNFDGTNGSTTTTDSSLFDHSISLSGTAQLSTSVKKYGTASLSIGSSGTCRSDFVMDYTSSDFTVESWFMTSDLSTEPIIFGTDISSFTSGFVAWLLFAGASGQIYLFSSSSGGSWNIASAIPSSTGLLSINTWHYITLVRSGSVLKVYIDGVECISVSGAGTLRNTGYLSLGQWSGGNKLNGYLDALRISNFAVYNSNFTPPSGQFSCDPGMSEEFCYIQSGSNNSIEDLPLISAIFSE